VLQRRHYEAVRHEAHSPLKVERRREEFGVGNEIHVVERVAAVEIVDFDGEEVVFAWPALLADGALAHGG
jgi:hypothetical protein